MIQWNTNCMTATLRARELFESIEMLFRVFSPHLQTTKFWYALRIHVCAAVYHHRDSVKVNLYYMSRRISKSSSAGIKNRKWRESSRQMVRRWKQIPKWCFCWIIVCRSSSCCPEKRTWEFCATLWPLHKDFGQNEHPRFGLTVRIRRRWSSPGHWCWSRKERPFL